MVSKKDTCLTIGTLLVTSPVRRAKTPTAIESRFVSGIEPSSAKGRGATKRRCLPSEDSSRIATSSCLQENCWLTVFTMRSAMSSSSSRRSGTRSRLLRHGRQDLVKLVHALLRAPSASRIIARLPPASPPVASVAPQRARRSRRPGAAASARGAPSTRERRPRARRWPRRAAARRRRRARARSAARRAPRSPASRRSSERVPSRSAGAPSANPPTGSRATSAEARVARSTSASLVQTALAPRHGQAGEEVAGPGGSAVAAESDADTGLAQRRHCAPSDRRATGRSRGTRRDRPRRLRAGSRPPARKRRAVGDHRVLPQHVRRRERVELLPKAGIAALGGADDPGDAPVAAAVRASQRGREAWRVREGVAPLHAYREVRTPERAVIRVMMQDRSDAGQQVAQAAEEQSVGRAASRASRPGPRSPPGCRRPTRRASGRAGSRAPAARWCRGRRARSRTPAAAVIPSRSISTGSSPADERSRTRPPTTTTSRGRLAGPRRDNEPDAGSAAACRLSPRRRHARAARAQEGRSLDRPTLEVEPEEAETDAQQRERAEQVLAEPASGGSAAPRRGRSWPVSSRRSARGSGQGASARATQASSPPSSSPACTIGGSADSRRSGVSNR